MENSVTFEGVQRWHVNDALRLQAAASPCRLAGVQRHLPVTAANASVPINRRNSESQYAALFV